MEPCFSRNDQVLLENSVPCLAATERVEYMQLEAAVPNIAEAFIVNVLSNGFFLCNQVIINCFG